jgi:hypothetical protein
MPNFWDSLKSVGMQAASTAGQVYQNSLGTFTGVAQDKIKQVANGIQGQVGNIVKPAQTQPAPAPKTAPTSQPAIPMTGLLIAAVLLYFLTRKI